MVKPRTVVKFPRTIDATAVLGVGSDPLPMLVDMSSARQDVIPFFFHVPKAAGSSLERILANKVGIRTLPAGDMEDLGFIERSQALQRKVVQYLKTPLFFEACSFLSRARVQVRCFTVIREPVSRMVSMFWYKKDSTWEKHYDPTAKTASLETFLKTAETDWLTWSLACAVVPRDVSLV